MNNTLELYPAIAAAAEETMLRYWFLHGKFDFLTNQELFEFAYINLLFISDWAGHC